MILAPAGNSQHARDISTKYHHSLGVQLLYGPTDNYITLRPQHSWPSSMSALLCPQTPASLKLPVLKGQQHPQELP
jgi:hypothetical protein